MQVEKLYGHGSEVMALTASHDGVLLASACSAKKAEVLYLILQGDSLRAHPPNVSNCWWLITARGGKNLGHSRMA